MIKEGIRFLLSRMGFTIHRITPEQATQASRDQCFVDMVNKVRPYTMLSMDRLYSLYSQTRHCETAGIEGALVECGVWKGGAVALMALANQAFSGTRRDIHLFDAFDHICAPDENVDGERAMREAQMWSRETLNPSDGLAPMTGFYDHFGGAGSVEGNRQLIEGLVGYPAHHLHFHKGWFQDTLPTDAKSIGKIAILRIDGDWYASTMVCLDYLFDQVVPGGFVIVDDYGAYEGCRKAVDEFLARTGKKLFMNRIDEEAVYFIVP
jgi:hypothetical protein